MTVVGTEIELYAVNALILIWIRYCQQGKRGLGKSFSLMNPNNYSLRGRWSVRTSSTDSMFCGDGLHNILHPSRCGLLANDLTNILDRAGGRSSHF